MVVNRRVATIPKAHESVANVSVENRHRGNVSAGGNVSDVNATAREGKALVRQGAGATGPVAIVLAAVLVVTVLVLAFPSGSGGVSVHAVRASAASAAADGKLGSITLTVSSEQEGGSDFIRTYRADEWSQAMNFDLTDDARIPPGAVVTGIVFTYGRSVGSFAMPERVVVDERGRRAVVNRVSGRTDVHNGKPVHQRWHIQFRTATIWSGPATIWPIVTIYYEY